MKNYCCNKLGFLALCLFFNYCAYGHFDKNIFSGLVEPYITYESNYAKIMSQQIQISGYGLGFEWTSGLALGLTYYQLNSKIFSHKYALSSSDNWLLHFQYISIVASYKILQQQKFVIRGELANGIGKVGFTDKDVKKTKYGIYCFEPALNFRYNIIEWLGLISQLGYRLAIPNGPPTIGDFSSLKFNIGFTISPMAFYKALKNNTLFN